MNPVGCHGLVWTSDFGADRFDQIAGRIAAAGFDLFEVPLMDPWGFDAEAAAQSLQRHGLQAVLSVGHDHGSDISAADFVAGIDAGNVKLHVDSFHMNIEETDLYTPLLAVSSLIGYAHVSENTRGYLGSGGVAFGDFFRGLADAGYTGPITFETFSRHALDPDLAGLLAVWRSFYDDTDDLAAHAATFIRNQLQAQSSGHAPRSAVAKEGLRS